MRPSSWLTHLLRGTVHAKSGSGELTFESGTTVQLRLWPQFLLAQALIDTARGRYDLDHVLGYWLGECNELEPGDCLHHER